MVFQASFLYGSASSKKKSVTRDVTITHPGLKYWELGISL